MNRKMLLMTTSFQMMQEVSSHQAHWRRARREWTLTTFQKQLWDWRRMKRESRRDNCRNISHSQKITMSRASTFGPSFAESYCWQSTSWARVSRMTTWKSIRYEKWRKPSSRWRGHVMLLLIQMIQTTTSCQTVISVPTLNWIHWYKIRIRKLIKRKSIWDKKSWASKRWTS